jgi:hypothetical protein
MVNKAQQNFYTPSLKCGVIRLLKMLFDLVEAL